jgi:L-asparagine transporter-like permease
MKKPMLLVTVSVVALIATTVLNLVFQELWISFIGVACVAVVLVLVGRLMFARRETANGRTVGIGTIRTVSDDVSTIAAGECQIMIEVASVHGETFIGRLIHRAGDPDMSMLRPGLVVLVAFDPAAREQLSLPDDVLAVRAACVDRIWPRHGEVNGRHPRRN